MENASKALIIAGAILISIILVGIGAFIVTNMQGTVDTTVSGMSAQEKQVFNSKFESYEGNQTPSSVKALITTTMAHNVSDPDRAVTIASTSSATPATAFAQAASSTQPLLSGLRTKVNSGKKYAVTLTYSGTTGLITAIAIAESN